MNFLNVKLTILFAFIFPFFLFCQEYFIINGKISQEFNGCKLYFGILHNNRVDYNRGDSVIIKDGTFSFKGNLDQISAFGTFTFKKNTFFYRKGFALSQGVNNCNLIINSDKQLAVLIKDSPANLVLSSVDSVYSKYNTDYKEKNKISGSFVLPAKLQIEARDKQLELLKSNVNNYISLLLLYNLSLYDNTINYLDKIMNIFISLPNEIRNSPFGLQFEKEKQDIRNAYLSTKISRHIPLFNIKKIDGSLFSNNQMKGKPYMIAFSATWCLPCQQYQPTLKKLYDKYRSKGFEIIYFNLDDNVKIWKRHILTKKLNWINVSERTKWKDSKISQQFNIKALPSYLIVDKNGIIIYNEEELKDFDHKLIESYIIKSLR